ncbi:MAG: DUF2971 domain-containing protein [Breznakibacter sp.]
MIYRYSGWDFYSQDSLKDRYFWFSKPTNFNDPFDSNMECLKAYNETTDVLCYEDDSQIGPLKNPYKYIKENTDNFGVLCFTEKTKPGSIGDKGFNNSHFWSHYANFHKGIALGFNKSLIETYYSSKIQCNADLTPVKYNTTMGNLGDKIKKILSKTPFDAKEFETFISDILLHKDSRIWGIENESRIILGGAAIANINNFNLFVCEPFHIINDSGYKIPYPEGEVLKEVTFGVKFPNNEIESAKFLINKSHQNVEFYQAELDFVNGDINRIKI